MDTNYTFCDQPYWFFEVTACISDSYAPTDITLLERHSKFGFTMEEMADFLSPYTQYKKAVTDEILPIYQEYPQLDRFFQPLNLDNEIDFNLMMTIVKFFGEQLATPLSSEAIDLNMNKLMEEELSDLAPMDQDTEIKIQNLTDLVTILNQTNLDNNYKLQMIDLYNRRFEIIKQLSELLLRCTAILQKHFPIIEQPYQETINHLRNKENLNQLLNTTIIKLKPARDNRLYVTIFFFNQFTMRYAKDSYQYFIGMYVSELVDRKAQNQFNDSRLVTDLKALSDPTRLRIIRILSNKKMYLQELSGMLNLTPATVSHHMTVLLQSEIVSLLVDGDKSRKIYYEINPEKLHSLGFSIQRLVNTNDIINPSDIS
ncbi:MAG: transcriptional regulator, ArsR family [Herbinix sp.]|jgi:DNA-binding transcriptional ArsR family regulator|nr:transcriptional regulator, ArsR family [Herbinix sp.]